MPAEVGEAILNQFDQGWGTDALLAVFLPSRAGDERFRHWYMKMQRAMASPKAPQAFLRTMLEVDVRTVLPLVHAPTLILHRRDVQLLPIEHGRYLASTSATPSWSSCPAPTRRSYGRSRSSPST